MLYVSKLLRVLAMRPAGPPEALALTGVRGDRQSCHRHHQMQTGICRSQIDLWLAPLSAKLAWLAWLKCLATLGFLGRVCEQLSCKDCCAARIGRPAVCESARAVLRHRNTQAYRASTAHLVKERWDPMQLLWQG